MIVCLLESEKVLSAKREQRCLGGGGWVEGEYLFERRRERGRCLWLLLIGVFFVCFCSFSLFVF